MFYELEDGIKEIDFDDLNKNTLTVGYVNCEELKRIGKKLGFDEETIVASQKANPIFRTGVDVHGKYTFSELKIVNRNGQEDYVSVFAKKKLLLIVDVADSDNSTIRSVKRTIQKYPASRMSLERLIAGFIESLLSDGRAIAEEIRNDLTEKEEAIVNDEVGDEFNVELLEIKKKILKFTNFYEQILDITEVLEENDNEILNDDRLIYISNLTSKVTRLSDDMKSLNNMADHIQDAYATLLDLRMNKTMKVFTIITSIFFPLTIIVGWYGMNFHNMPELGWKHGYLYVTLLSISIVGTLLVIGKKKKWF